MMDWLRPALTVALTAAAVAALSWVLRRARPAAASETGGTIAPDKVSAWFTVLFGVAMIAGGVGAVAYIPETGVWIGLLLAALGVACAGFMAPSLGSMHVVHWTERGVEGPARTFGPTLGMARTEIAWPDLVRTGKTSTGYWFVEAQDGRRVYWSYLYKGYGVLTSMLRSRCPELELPADMG